MIQPSTSLTRRTATRLLATGVAALGVPLATGARGADAARAWCRTDPVVMIGGVIVDIFIAGPLDAPLLVTGPNQVVVVVPVGVDATLVAKDLGFGRGEEVSFKESNNLTVTENGIEVIVRVYVPARDDAMPVRVEFAPRLLGILSPEWVEGTANEWVVLRTTL